MYTEYIKIAYLCSLKIGINTSKIKHTELMKEINNKQRYHLL